MLVTLCIGQVREVRGFEQIRYSALLRSTARLSVMSVLVLKIERLTSIYTLQVLSLQPPPTVFSSSSQ